MVTHPPSTPLFFSGRKQEGSHRSKPNEGGVLKELRRWALKPREQDSNPSSDSHQLVGFDELQDHLKNSLPHIQNEDNTVYLMVVIKINNLIYKNSQHVTLY